MDVKWIGYKIRQMHARGLENINATSYDWIISYAFIFFYYKFQKIYVWRLKNYVESNIK